MIRRLAAIAALTARSAVRSRIFLALTALLVLIVIGLPFTIEGDGTTAGIIRILLSYTPALAGIVLGVAALWTAGAAVSREIEDKPLQLVAVKPVRCFELWLGKWAGILALNGVLLGVTGLAVYGAVQFRMHDGRMNEQEIRRVRRELLVARRRVTPESATLDRRARRFLERLRADGLVPASMSPREALCHARRDIVIRRGTVPPGASCGWLFDLKDRAAAAGLRPESSGRPGLKSFRRFTLLGH